MHLPVTGDAAGMYDLLCPRAHFALAGAEIWPYRLVRAGTKVRLSGHVQLTIMHRTLRERGKSPWFVWNGRTGVSYGDLNVMARDFEVW